MSESKKLFTPEDKNTNQVAIDQYFATFDLTEELGKIHQDIHDVTNTPSASLEKQKTEEGIRELAEKIIESITPFGQVVADLQKEGATRLCVCIKTCHGWAQHDAKEAIDQPLHGQAFLRHQNRIVSCQKIIADVCEIKNLQLFIEPLPQDENENDAYLSLLEAELRNHEPASYSEMDQLCVQAELDITMSNSICQLIHEAVRCDDDQGDTYYCQFQGDHRFFLRNLVEKKLKKNQLHGIDNHNLSREEMMAACIETAQQRIDLPDDESDKQLYKFISSLGIEKWTTQHAELINQMNHFVEEGKIGVIVLGAEHFREGHNIIHTKDFDEVRIESCIEKQKSLKDMRVIVIEPHGLINSRGDTSSLTTHG